MIVDPDFLDHWKTRMLIGLLDGDENAPFYVLRIWAHCQNRRQDTFDNLIPEALKSLCRFPGHANKLDSSLSASGFIRREGKSLVVCGWMKKNASLFAAWENGKKGGRPQRKPTAKPADNPWVNPGGTREEKSREEKIERPPKVPLSQIVDRWNATEGVVSIRQLNNKRVVALKARLAEDDWLWEEALAKFPLMCFQDSDGWKPNFDWFIKPNTVGKILEGAYDWKKESGVEKKPYRYDRQKLIEEAKSWRP